MARVVVAPSARDDLAHLITVLHLPENTRARVKARLSPLARTPEQGAPLEGRWVGFRFILGPWPWMLIVYAYDQEEDRGDVVTIEDARRAHSATAS